MSKKDKKPKIRRTWHIDPVTKIEADSTQEYDRAEQKRDWLQQIEEEIKNADDGEEFFDE